MSGPDWLYRRRHPGERYSPMVEFARGIEAATRLPVIEQSAFAFGDPGTESGHSLDTINTNRTVEGAGGGNYQFFLREELAQSIPNANSDLTQAFKLQYQRNGGTWTDVTASSSFVRVVADSNITDGAATTDRLSSSTNPFTAGSYDEGDGTTGSVTWDPGVGVQHSEFLWSLEVVDADMGAGDTLAFRVVHDDGAVLDTYTVTATLTWNAAAGESRSASDTVDFGDEPTGAIHTTAAPSDTVDFGEDFTTVISWVDGPSDTVDFGDSASGSTAGAETASASDTIELGESLTLAVDQDGGPDTTVFGDEISTRTDNVAALSDTVDMGDEAATTGAATRSLSDTVEFGDGAATRTDNAAALSDTIEAGDSATTRVDNAASLSDTIDFGDAAEGSATTPGSRSVSDTVEFGENFDTVISWVDGPSDTVDFGDAATGDASGAETASVSDTVEMGDSATTAIHTSASVSESVDLGEDITLAVEQDGGPEGVVFGDSVTGSVAGAETGTLSDTVEFGDSATAQGEGGRSATDGLTLSDALTILAAFQASGSDGATFGDDVSTVASFAAAASDAAAFGDATAAAAAFAASVSEGTTFGDEVATSTGVVPAPQHFLGPDGISRYLGADDTIRRLGPDNINRYLGST